MAKITSDHIPCKIAINTKIPRSSIFRFENFWAEHDTFLETVHGCWESCPSLPVATRTISSKFKKLRSELKSWSRNLCNLKLLISNCNTVIGFLDSLEDSRPLYNKEANLRLLVKGQLKTLLHYKKLYRRKRYTVNRIKLGDECTKFFTAWRQSPLDGIPSRRSLTIKVFGFKTMLSKLVYCGIPLEIGWE
jgi:hypothetical protein